MSAPLQVVAGIIVRESRILLAQRPPPKDYAFKWESAGGKVELGESPQQALARELSEEYGLSLSVHAQRVALAVVGRPDGRVIHVSFYLVEISRLARVRSLEGQGFGWFTEAEMRRLDLAPANLMEIEKISSIVRSS